MATPKKQELDPDLDKLLAQGFPVKRAVFHDTVVSWSGDSNGSPEFQLYDAILKPRPHRLAEMVYTPIGLFVRQKTKIKIVPLANVKEVDLL